MRPPSTVIELRQYTLHPGQRDTLIELFDREFVETQEACGMEVLGQFRDLDRPDHFVWLRGFADMPSRADALGRFYGGPVWKAHRNAANATMIDSDDVLLLRLAAADAGFALADVTRPAPGATAIPGHLVVATICSLHQPASAELLRWFDDVMAPSLIAAGATPIARLVTEPSINNFPALPVREGEPVFAWFARFADEPAHRAHLAALALDRSWQQEIGPEWRRHLRAAPQSLRLQPTARSRLA